jgi:hypothetical protein
MGDRAGETTGDNTAISGSSDSNRKKKLSELIPQIKNQG